MRVHDREPIAAAMRRFKKLVERSGLMREQRAHEYCEKPCEAWSRKAMARTRAIRKAVPRADREAAVTVSRGILPRDTSAGETIAAPSGLR